MPEMKIEYLPIDSVRPYDRNAKKHPPEQVQQIANSIKEFGWKQPLVIDPHYCIVIGHGRWLAAKKLGYETVPCIVTNDLTAEQLRILRITDNKTAESEWDAGMLEFELAGFIDYDMSKFGFTAAELGEINYDELFGEADEKPPKKIQCPNCKEWFEV